MADDVTPLIEKLGIKAYLRVTILSAPKNYIDCLGKLPNGVTIEGDLNGKYAFIQYFCHYQVELKKKFPLLKEHLYPTGMLWISWPKVFRQPRGDAKVETDLNENVLRDIGLENGLVDVKVIAVNEYWSGLKFVFRLKDR